MIQNQSERTGGERMAVLFAGGSSAVSVGREQFDFIVDSMFWFVLQTFSSPLSIEELFEDNIVGFPILLDDDDAVVGHKLVVVGIEQEESLQLFIIKSSLIICSSHFTSRFELIKYCISPSKVSLLAFTVNKIV